MPNAYEIVQTYIGALSANTITEVFAPDAAHLRAHLCGLQASVASGSATLEVLAGATSGTAQVVGSFTLSASVPLQTLPVQGMMYGIVQAPNAGHKLFLRSATALTNVGAWSMQGAGTAPTSAVVRPTATPKLRKLTKQAIEGQAVQLRILNFRQYANPTFSYLVDGAEPAGGVVARNGDLITWNQPADAGDVVKSHTLQVFVTDGGRAQSLPAAAWYQFMPPVSIQPTFGGFPSGWNEGTSATGSISNWPGASASIEFTFNGTPLSLASSAGGVNNYGTPTRVAFNPTTGALTLTLPTDGDSTPTSHTLSAIITEAGKAAGAAGVLSITANEVGGQPTTATPVLSGFPTSANEGTTVTGTIAPTGGGSYNSPTYEFRTSNDGGATWSPWTACVNSGGGQTAVRVSGTTVSYDLPTVSGDGNTQHRLEMRVTDSGKTVSNTSNTVPITGNAVLAGPQTATPTVGTPEVTALAQNQSTVLRVTNWNSFDKTGLNLRTVPAGGVFNPYRGDIVIPMSSAGSVQPQVFLTEQGKTESAGATASAVNVRAMPVVTTTLNPSLLVPSAPAVFHYDYDAALSGYRGIDTQFSTPTIAWLDDLSGTHPALQSNKTQQVGWSDSAGAKALTGAFFPLNNTTGIANNVNALYFAAAIRIDSSITADTVNRMLFYISLASSPSTPLFAFGFQGASTGRRTRVWAWTTGTSTVSPTCTNSLTNDTWTYVEAYLDLAANTVSFWTNGTPDGANIALTGRSAGNSPASNAQEIAVFTAPSTGGGTTYGASRMDCRALWVAHAMPTGAELTNLRNYLAAKRDAA